MVDEVVLRHANPAASTPRQGVSVGGDDDMAPRAFIALRGRCRIELSGSSDVFDNTNGCEHH